MVINSNLTVSACDLLTEIDRSKDHISHPTDIEQLWQNDSIFHKWRKPIHSENISIKNLPDSCLYSCPIVNETYNYNIF